jgi:hypothetical protein
LFEGSGSGSVRLPSNICYCNQEVIDFGGSMLTGELRSKIDNVWNAFAAGGISNPLEVIEQITYLLFMRGLDDAHTLEENKATRLNKPMERHIFPPGKDRSARAAASPMRTCAGRG